MINWLYEWMHFVIGLSFTVSQLCIFFVRDSELTLGLFPSHCGPSLRSTCSTENRLDQKKTVSDGNKVLHYHSGLCYLTAHRYSVGRLRSVVITEAQLTRWVKSKVDEPMHKFCFLWWCFCFLLCSFNVIKLFWTIFAVLICCQELFCVFQWFLTYLSHMIHILHIQFLYCRNAWVNKKKIKYLKMFTQ